MEAEQKKSMEIDEWDHHVFDVYRNVLFKWKTAQKEICALHEKIEHHSLEEEKIREQLDVLIGIMPIPVLILNGDGYVVQTNVMADDFFEKPVIGHLWRNFIKDFVDPKPDDGHEISLKNGKKIKIITQSLKNLSGQIIVLMDLTESFRWQKEHAHQKQLATMGKMAAILAHQVRTPLSTSMIYAEHMLNDHLSKNKKIEFSQKLMDSLKKTNEEIKNILLFSKGGENVVCKIKAEDFFQDLSKRYEDRMLHLQIVYHTFFDKKLKSKNFFVNKDTLCSAIDNLIENARDAVGQGGVISLSMILNEGDFLEINVQDNGPGMNPSSVEKIFEPFFTTKTKGTGLGLAVVQSVVHAHGGRCSVVSSSEKGTCFKIILPIEGS